MMKRFVRQAKSKRGQTIIEFALVAPMIILLLATIVDFGIAIDRRLALQHAVREGARLGAVDGNVLNIQQRTVDQAQDIIGTGDVTVCYEDKSSPLNGNPGNIGDAVTVSATFTYEPLLIGPVLQGLFGENMGNIDMTPHGTARLEQTVAGASAC